MPRNRHIRARNHSVSAIRHVASLGFSPNPHKEIDKNSLNVTLYYLVIKIRLKYYFKNRIWGNLGSLIVDNLIGLAYRPQ